MTHIKYHSLFSLNKKVQKGTQWMQNLTGMFFVEQLISESHFTLIL